MEKTLRGFYAIALTPFNEVGDLLWDELARECDWIVRAGAHGIVWPVNDSEQYVLSAAERVEGFKLLVQAVGGRIPVVAGVADNSKALLDLPYPSGIKEILVRRGVFSSNSRRSIGSVALDGFHQEELARGLKAVEPYFRL